MYNIFDIQALINFFKNNDDYGIPEELYAITILSLLEESEKHHTDINFYDIQTHYYNKIFNRYI